MSKSKVCVFYRGTRLKEELRDVQIDENMKHALGIRISSFPTACSLLI
jgi:hypothetical protein